MSICLLNSSKGKIKFLSLIFFLCLLTYQGFSISGPWDQHKRKVEVVSLRTQNAKHFTLANGKTVAYFASGSIHYKVGDQWLEIDNQIVPAEKGKAYAFFNYTNDFKTEYPSNPFTGFVKTTYHGSVYQERVKRIVYLTAEGNEIGTMAILPGVFPKSKANQLVYANIARGIDLVYTQTNDGRKLDLVINQKSALDVIPSKAAFIAIEEEMVLPNGAKITKYEGEQVIMKGKAVEATFVKPYATESADGKSYTSENQLIDEATQSVALVNKSFIVSTRFNVNWIRSAERQFPVKLDPSINYGPFNVTNATGRMTTATGAKTSGFLRLAGTNTFTWAKFNLSGLSSIGAISIDSCQYWGNQWGATNSPDKIAKFVDMDSIDPVANTNLQIVARINAASNYCPGYVFAGSAFAWRLARIDTAFNSRMFGTYASRGWAAVGMTYLSGATGFSYHYGIDAIGTANSALTCYLQVYYTLPPCSNPITAGNTSGPSFACAGSSIALSLTGASVGAGMTYQWQSSLDSLTWSNDSGAVFETYNRPLNTDSIYLRCILTCNAGTPVTSAPIKVKADLFRVTPGNSYNEGFESITTNNTLPACMAATNLSTLTLTYATAPGGAYNQSARTGTKMASFRWGANDFFFSKGLVLDSSKTYEFSVWYITDGGYGGGWDSLSLYLATAPNASSVTLIPGGTVTTPTNVTYQRLSGSMKPPLPGVYRLGIKVKDAGIPWYLSIDDIQVKESTAPIVVTGTKSNITNSTATIAGNITDNGGANVTMSGVVYSTLAAPVKGGPGVVDSMTTPTATSGVFNMNIAGLLPNTLYYYRAYAQNAMGITYGADSSFTTAASANLPNVVTQSAINVGTIAATVRGNIISNGGASVTTSGILVSTTSNPTLTTVGVIDSVTNPSVGLGTYSFALSGLNHSTKYYFRAYAINSVGTAYSIQDSFNTAPIVNYLPYSQNFDTIGVTTGWSSASVGTAVNDWVLGNPSKTQITSAFSGTRCWVTKTTGNYSDNANCVVVSPQFDFSSATADPLIRFRHNFNSESGWDGGILEMDTNNSGTWIKLDNVLGTGANFNTPVSNAWYNGTINGAAIGNGWQNASTAYSSANTGGWVQSQTRLVGAAGKGNVKVRFRFASDGFVNQPDGWAIDNIEVFPPTAPAVATGTKTNITTNSVTLAGTISSNGNATITAGGFVFSTLPSPVLGGPGVIDSAIVPAPGVGSITKNISGLMPATLYYYRAYAINGVGTSYGADSTFTTNSSAVAPTVLKVAATGVSGFGAIVGGNITSNGGAPVTVSGIVYATTPNPALSGLGVVDSATSPTVGAGTFSFNLAGLNPGTKYYFRAYAANTVGTAYSVQDSFTTSPVISWLPYAQNFDTANLNTGWSSTAIGVGLNDWVVGTPNKPQITSAFSSPNSWVTKTSGAYSDNHNGAVVSPQFDFSSTTINPIIRFRNNFGTEGGWDGLVLEMDTTGTGVWFKIDNTIGTGTNFNTANSTAWYNGNANTVGSSFQANSTNYATQSGGWIQSQTTLTGAAGKNNVKIRFRFAADGFVNTPNGCALDNIEVFLPSAPGVVTGTKTNITTSQATLAGNITTNGGQAVTASGIVYGTSPNPTRGSAGVVDSATNPLVGAGNFIINVSGLATATQYYYRAYAVNGVGTTYGADSTFTTNSSAVVPTIVNAQATLVSTTTARIGGNITSNGGSTVLSSGVVYSLTPNPSLLGTGVTDSTTSPAVTSGSFSFGLAGLTSNTKYYFRAYATNSVGTAYGANDSFFTAPIISTFPYSQNFDGPASIATGWSSVATGGTNEWALGTPSKAQITSAYSAPNSWVTKLSGNYADNSDAAVVSPQFNFSSFTNDPIVGFYHNFGTESGWDGGVLELSTNGGTTWSKVDDVLATGTTFNTPLSAAWYNGTVNVFSISGNAWQNTSTNYAGANNGWIYSQTRLQGAAGQSNVRFRFRFAADGFVNTPNGWAFDNVSVIEVNTPTTQASSLTITNIANDSCTLNWVNGNGSRRIVVARLTSGTTIAPADSQFYNANRVFSSGTNLGSGNFVVYDGTANTVNVRGLATATGYTFTVYEYNGSLMHTKYLRPGASNTMITLPVSYLYFEGARANDDAILDWATSQEINNDGFVVERSVDGKNFDKVAFVKGAGNSKVKNLYNYKHEAAFGLLQVNTLYYRLKQVDRDGKFAYSNIVKVSSDDQGLDQEVKVYPNPFVGETGIRFDKINETEVNVAVYDITGKLVMSTSLQLAPGKHYYSLEKLNAIQPGVYIIAIKGTQTFETFKVQKLN